MKHPVDCIGREEVVQVLNKMEAGKVLGPWDASLELIIEYGMELVGSLLAGRLLIIVTVDY